MTQMNLYARLYLRPTIGFDGSSAGLTLTLTIKGATNETIGGGKTSAASGVLGRRWVVLRET